MKEKAQNIEITINVEELLEKIETKYLLDELKCRYLSYDVIFWS